MNRLNLILAVLAVLLCLAPANAQMSTVGPNNALNVTDQGIRGYVLPLSTASVAYTLTLPSAGTATRLPAIPMGTRQIIVSGDGSWNFGCASVTHGADPWFNTIATFANSVATTKTFIVAPGVTNPEIWAAVYNPIATVTLKFLYMK